MPSCGSFFVLLFVTTVEMFVAADSVACRVRKWTISRACECTVLSRLSTDERSLETSSSSSVVLLSPVSVIWTTVGMARIRRDGGGVEEVLVEELSAIAEVAKFVGGVCGGPGMVAVGGGGGG